MTITESGVEQVDSTPPPSPTPETPKSTKRSAGNAFQALTLRLHFYAGVFIAPFILIAAVTGALYAIAPTLETVVDRGLLHTDSTGPTKPLSEQVAAAVATKPELALNAVAPAQNVGDTTRVIFSDPSLGDSERRAVFVDPVTAQPIGDSVVYGSSGALETRTWIDQLHRDLHLGDIGRYYSEVAASWMWLVALAGLVLWYRRVRARREKRSAGWLFRPDRSKPRARTLNWHAAVGIWILPIVLLLSATGMTWSKYAGENVADLRKAMSWTTPAVSAKLPGSTGPAEKPAGDHSGHGGGGAPAAAPSPNKAALVDTVYGVARANGLEGPLEISIPAKDGTAFVAKELRRPGVYTQDSIAVEGATGNVTDTLRFADWPLMAKLTSWGIAFHMGLLFGLLNQLLLLAVMIGLITVIVRGYLMWWRRRPTKENKLAAGRAPRRGAGRQTPLVVLVPFAAAAVFVAWYVPMIGIPLLAFLAVDVLLGLVAKRRTPAA
ncbi:PepSY domain-containing protein [Nocardia sp. 2]|uniref:PepSY domain-containing protein n=1 Tax=Nocardia acididurans TaxID=2802282 RepID=A0ABS1M474_9NOCA|nr:PepSY-associated TM helix domain-containing protein [Nocardia acididurans]MBL1074850.1 PepSY domain-containing protein [Nocardia acididurans]